MVTGGAGFLGSHLCRRLLDLGCEVVCLDNLSTGSEVLLEPLRAEPGFSFQLADVSAGIDVDGVVDYVLHLASPASPPGYLRLPIETLDVGALGTRHALELARAGGARFLLASTSEVYGDPTVHPQPETYWGNVNPVGPRSVYDEAKRVAEAYTMAYHRRHGVDTRIVRIFNTYGPGMQADDGRAIPNFASQALRGEPITVYGDGSQTRSLCYVDDLVEGILRLLASDEADPVNIGNQEEMTMLQLAEAVRAACELRQPDRAPAAARGRPPAAPTRYDAGPRAAGLGGEGAADGGPAAHDRVVPEPAAVSDGAPILVVGSVALDSIETPFATRDDVLGGAALHFSVAASLFTRVRLVAVVGADFPMERLDLLRARNIDMEGLEVSDGETFRWRGRYHLDMDHRDTLDLQLGVFADFHPKLPESYLDSEVVFLANTDPELQLRVLDQVPGAKLTACDTIDHWITEKRRMVDELFGRVDLVFLNEDEARLYADTPNLQKAARIILDRGSRAVLIKKGENGALVVRRTESGTETFACAAYPLEEVVDPTGAGDAFAGGVMGVLAGSRSFDLGELRRAVGIGTIMASYNVEGFGPHGLEKVAMSDVLARYGAVREMVALPD